jgi:hypothetical protein
MDRCIGHQIHWVYFMGWEPWRVTPVSNGTRRDGLRSEVTDSTAFDFLAVK